MRWSSSDRGTVQTLTLSFAGELSQLVWQLRYSHQVAKDMCSERRYDRAGAIEEESAVKPEKGGIGKLKD